MGTPVEYQPTFDVLRETMPRYPHLVRMLKRQGYTTGTLQPPVRSRAGLPVANPYDFDKTLYFDDLDYDGPNYGWGIVPDQYSLALAHEQFVAPAKSPFFLFFETVTTHSPWDRAAPPLVSDPSLLENTAPLAQSGHFSMSSVEQLFKHVKYDWKVLARYLRKQAPTNSLIIVLGDHQPKVASRADMSTPFHVLSREETLIRRFKKQGFASGLQLDPAADTLHHAGVYPLLMQTLTAHSGATDTLPSSRLRGVDRAALLPKRP